MIHVKLTSLLLSLIAVLVLTGCGGQEPAPEATPTQAASAEAATEMATEAVAGVSPLEPASPLAAPASPLPSPEAEAAPTSDAGSIIGRILVVKPEGEIEVADMIIGLAEVIRDENGVARVGGYEPSRAPRASTDAYGRFIFNDVKPGTYTLILDAIVTQYQLADEKSGNTIMTDVKAGEVADLGTMEYSSLPVPGLK